MGFVGGFFWEGGGSEGRILQAYLTNVRLYVCLLRNNKGRTASTAASASTDICQPSFVSIKKWSVWGFGCTRSVRLYDCTRSARLFVLRLVFLVFLVFLVYVCMCTCRSSAGMNRDQETERPRYDNFDCSACLDGHLP